MYSAAVKASFPHPQQREYLESLESGQLSIPYFRKKNKKEKHNIWKFDDGLSISTCINKMVQVNISTAGIIPKIITCPQVARCQHCIH